MNAVMALARQYGLFVVEDAAQGMMSRYQGGRWAPSVISVVSVSTKPRITPRVVKAALR